MDGVPGNGLPSGSRLAKFFPNSGNGGTPPARTSNSIHTMSPNVPSFVPQQQLSQMSLSDVGGDRSPFAAHRQFPSGSSGLDHLADHNPYQQENISGTMYFFSPGQGAHSPQLPVGGDVENGPVLPEGHTLVTTNGCFAYQGATPHIGRFRPKNASNNVAQFITPELKLELVHRQLAMEARADPAAYPDLPQSIEHLNDWVPLEPPPPPQQAHATIDTVYKAHSVRDGVPYCVRRVHDVRLGSPKQLQPAEQWKKLNNVHVVQLRELIHTRAFGDNSLLFVYDYHPLAETLRTRHYGKSAGFIDSASGSKIGGMHASHLGAGAGVVESQLWSYIVQLSSALRAIHATGLAARCVDLSRILVHGKNKLLLGGCAIQDVVRPDPAPIQQQQTDDLHAFGRVIVCLATGNAAAPRRDLIAQSLQYIAHNYSPDMKNLINFLLSPAPNGRKSINEIMPMIGARFYSQLETAQIRNDMMENELSKELENGRLFRLLSKLNTIVERPEHNLDPSWAETGDRFLLKLFRDYVFHQVTESGKPWMDMAHIVHTLNKLDAGVSERIELVSRDGDNVIIVSYADLRRCVDNSFRELCQAQTVVPRHPHH